MSRYDEIAREFAASANELDEALLAFSAAADGLKQAKRKFAESRQQLLGCKRVQKVLEDPFTDRELEVIQCSLSQWSQADISRELKITVSTVKYHLSNIYPKLNIVSCKSLSEALKKKHPEIFTKLTGQTVSLEISRL